MLLLYYLLIYYFLLFRQWSALQDVVNKDSGSKKINNETLQLIRINNSPAPQNTKLQRAASAKKKKFYQPHDDKIEELNDTLALSMCNASDLSIFSDDNSRDDIILDESNMVIWVVKFSSGGQRYAYRVLQTIQMKLILLCLGRAGSFGQC